MKIWYNELLSFITCVCWYISHCKLSSTLINFFSTHRKTVSVIVIKCPFCPACRYVVLIRLQWSLTKSTHSFFSYKFILLHEEKSKKKCNMRFIFTFVELSIIMLFSTKDLSRLSSYLIFIKVNISLDCFLVTQMNREAKIWLSFNTEWHVLKKYLTSK